jgi:uncharacterized membrane protein YfhO
VVVLSASFDPGWSATVDGRPVPTEMVAPALVAARVPAGVHRVAFRYAGYGGYPWLLALSLLALVAVGLPTARARRRRALHGVRSSAPPERP